MPTLTHTFALLGGGRFGKKEEFVVMQNTPPPPTTPERVRCSVHMDRG